MAKRKRLDPPKTDYLGDPAPGPFAARPLSAPAPIAGVAGDAAASAAAAELAQTLSDARAQGRMVITLGLDDIDTGYLVRDRLNVILDEMDALVASIRARGQQTPIEVVDLGPKARPRYGLISGWRRMHALRAIAESGESVTVLALLRTPTDAADAYLAMVEENEIRVNLSYYERANVALKAVEQGAFPNTKTALLTLYHAASRAKRSKIRSFMTVVEALDGTLTYPEEMGERIGLRLAKALDTDPGLKRHLRLALDNALADDGATEQAVIADVLKDRSDTGSISAQKAPKVADEPTGTWLGSSLYYSETDAGAVTLSGAAMTPEFKRDLFEWLSARSVD